MNDIPNPILILSVAAPDGMPIEAPLFVAVHVTASLLTRLSKLSRLCKAHRLAWMATEHVEPPVYWDVSTSGLVDVTTTWHTVDDMHYAELMARRPRPDGGHGLPEVIGETPVIALSELQHLRAHGIVIDFREHDGHEDATGEPFVAAVIDQMKARGLWPAQADPVAVGLTRTRP